MVGYAKHRNRLNRIVNQLERLANQFPVYFMHAYNKAIEHAQALNTGINNPYKAEEGSYVLAEAEVSELGLLKPNEKAKQRIINNQQFKLKQEEQKTKGRKRTKKGNL